MRPVLLLLVPAVGGDGAAAAGLRILQDSCPAVFPCQMGAFLKPDAEAALHLARLESVGEGRLIRYDSPGGRAVDIHSRVSWLEVIQDVRKLKHQCGADPLPDSNVLGDGRVQVPGWEPADYACSTVRGVKSRSGRRTY